MAGSTSCPLTTIIVIVGIISIVGAYIRKVNENNLAIIFHITQKREGSNMEPCHVLI